jgi:hypothetical protein
MTAGAALEVSNVRAGKASLLAHICSLVVMQVTLWDKFATGGDPTGGPSPWGLLV